MNNSHIVEISTIAAAFVGAVACEGCGSSAAVAPPARASATVVQDKGLEGMTLSPQRPALGLTLRNYTGRQVTLSSMRGKAILVTFVSTHCADVCPLIVAGLAAAQRELGEEARKVRIVAVTVDPRRDTPAAIRRFLTARDALGRMYYLLGTPAAGADMESVGHRRHASREAV